MQPTCIAYAKQTIAYALHMQPRAIAYATQTFAYALHVQPSFCICKLAIAYATQLLHMQLNCFAYATHLFCICNPSVLHMQPSKYRSTFSVLNFELAPMKLTQSNAYDRGKIVSVPLDTYRSRNKKF